MTQALITERLQAQFPNAAIEVAIDGSHVNVSVVDEAFEGCRPVKRQQMVYAALNSLIADGTVHAVNMTTQTPAEAQA